MLLPRLEGEPQPKPLKSFISELESATARVKGIDAVKILYSIVMNDVEGNCRYVEPNPMVRMTVKNIVESICFGDKEPGWFSEEGKLFNKAYQFVEAMIVATLSNAKPIETTESA